MEPSTRNKIKDLPKAVFILPENLHYLDVTGRDIEIIDELSNVLYKEGERAEWLQIYLRLVNENTPAKTAADIANSYYQELQKRFEK